MSEEPVRLYPRMSSLLEGFSSTNQTEQASTAIINNDSARLEPSTCAEAETFALRVLDDSMQPEFRKGCIILIDPTGRATDGSYVLAKTVSASTDGSPSEYAVDEDTGDAEELLEQYLFRQLRQESKDQWYLQPLNSDYQSDRVEIALEDIAGVIVQRAGTRRSYHKHYA